MSPQAPVLDDNEVQDIQVQKKTGEKETLKRLNLNLTPSAFKEVQTLAHDTNRSMTELVRLGLALAKIAHQAREKNLKLAVVDNNGTPVREIVIP